MTYVILVIFIILWFFFSLFRYMAKRLKKLDDRLDLIQNKLGIENMEMELE